MDVTGRGRGRGHGDGGVHRNSPPEDNWDGELFAMAGRGRARRRGGCAAPVLASMEIPEVILGELQQELRPSRVFVGRGRGRSSPKALQVTSKVITEEDLEDEDEFGSSDRGRGRGTASEDDLENLLECPMEDVKSCGSGSGGRSRGRGVSPLRGFKKIPEDVVELKEAPLVGIVTRGRGRGLPMASQEKPEIQEAPKPTGGRSSPVASQYISENLTELLEEPKPIESSDVAKLSEILKDSFEGPVTLNIPNFSLSDYNVPLRSTYAAAGHSTVAAATAADDDECIPWNGGTPRWITGVKSDLEITDLVKDCLICIALPGYRCFECQYLPSPAKITPEVNTEAWCHVIRFSSPSDFHVIFTESYDWFNLNAFNRMWTHFFRHEVIRGHPYAIFGNDLQELREAQRHAVRENYCFHSPYEVFTALRFILTEFLETLHEFEHYGKCFVIQNEVSFDVGGLVIVTKLESGRKMGYRAVIMEKVKIVGDCALGPDRDQDGFIVYLLDTGEKRVVGKKALVPLPRPFIAFRPLAVPCSLARVRPTDGSECCWGEPAVSAFRNILRYHDGKFSAKIYARKYSIPLKKFKKPEMLDGALEMLTSSPPFLVDLMDLDGEEEDVGTRLAMKGLAILAPFDSSGDPEEGK